MKRYIAIFLCFLLLFPLASCKTDNVGKPSKVAISMRMVAGITVTNHEDKFLRLENYQLVGDMEYTLSRLGDLSSLSILTYPSEIFQFQIPVVSYQYDVSATGFDENNSVMMRQHFSIYSGTATLYQDGSVVLDGDLTEFWARIQLPEDSEYWWVVHGTGAEQDHVEIYFKNGEPVVDTINDDLIYTVEKREVPLLNPPADPPEFIGE